MAGSKRLYGNLEFQRPEEIDTSNWFNQRNHRGRRIGEVALMGPFDSFHTLEEAIKVSKKEGHFLDEITILNIAHGEPSKNEPAEAILLREQGVTDGRYSGIIVRRSVDKVDSYELYFNSEFRFME